MRSLSNSISLTKYNQTIDLNPLSLFANGEQGVWYDPSDINLDWRYNIISYSEQIENSVWIKIANTVTTNSTVAPDGTTTADTCTPDTTSSLKYTQNQTFSKTIVGNSNYTVSFYAKANGYDWVSMEVLGYKGVYAGSAKYNLSTGTSAFNGRVNATANVSQSMTSVGNGWYRCVLTCTIDSSVNPTSTPRIQFLIDTNGTFNSFSGNGTSGIFVWGFQVENTSTATSYQKITDGIQDYYAYQPLPVLYQDYQGTQPVTAVEQPVGLMLDKSKGLVLGAELWVPASVTLGAGWGRSVDVFTTDGTSANLSLAALTTGKTYKFNATVTGGTLNFYLGASTFLTTVTGAVSWVGVAADSNIYVQNASAGVKSVTNISVREITGSHAYQSTSASCPTLSARYNLIGYTENLENSAWIKDSGVVATDNYATAPDGTMTASRVTFSGINITIRQPTSVSSGQAKTSVWLNGTAGETTLVSTLGYDELVTLTGNWQLYTGTKNYVSGNMIFSTYGGATARDILIWHPDMRMSNHASGLPIYQKVLTNTNYDTIGFPPYLKCDGVDDGMSTNSIDFSGTDAVTISSGVRNLTTSGVGTLLELSAGADVNNGAFHVRTPYAGVGSQVFQTGGTADSNAIASGFGAPLTYVMSCQGDISADEAKVRINGVQSALSSSDQGTGNYGNYPLYLFRRNNSDLPYTGYVYGLIIRGATTDTNTVKRIEKYLNKKVGKIY